MTDEMKLFKLRKRASIRHIKINQKARIEMFQLLPTFLTLVNRWQASYIGLISDCQCQMNGNCVKQSLTVQCMQ